MLTGSHLVRRTLHEAVRYPHHAPRTESAEYRALREQMVVVEDLACLVCGVRQSTLSDPAHNPHGARQMEVHHRLVEWALTGAVDLDRFNRLVVARLRAKRPDDPTYAADMTQAEMEAWIDHGRGNAWVLCDVHHRSPAMGIHSITYPLWTVQDLVRPDIDLLTGDSDAAEHR